MELVTVVYHHEDSTWWAESDDVPGFTVVADDLVDARRMVHEGLDLLGAHDDVLEVLDTGAVLSGSRLYRASVGSPTSGWSAVPVRQLLAPPPGTHVVLDVAVEAVA